jgi:hypothetical protein
MSFLQQKSIMVMSYHTFFTKSLYQRPVKGLMAIWMQESEWGFIGEDFETNLPSTSLNLNPIKHKGTNWADVSDADAKTDHSGRYPRNLTGGVEQQFIYNLVYLSQILYNTTRLSFI